MLKRLISVGTSGILIYCGILPVKQAKASAMEEYPPFSDDDVTRAGGLIYQYHSSVSVSSSGDLSFTAWTSSRKTMSSIGIINISVQRSSNGTIWNEEKTLTDKLTSNSDSFSLYNYTVPVAGGYHYRIVCEHYADNGSGMTQSVSHTTNSVWIS